MIENFYDLIKQAQQMLQDRPRPVQDTIYEVAKMETDLRSAIVIAYNFLYPKDGKDEHVD